MNKENIIYEINYPINYKKINIVFEKNKLELKKLKLEYALQELETREEVLKAQSTEKKRDKIKEDIFLLDSEYEKSKKTNEIIDDIYVTFYSTDHCEEIKSAYKKSKFYRFVLHLFCCSSKINHL